MPKTDFNPQPHAAAAALIAGKPPVVKRVFERLLPELKARAFTVAGLESANGLQRVRDAVAGVPLGEQTWDEAKKQIVEELEPYLGDGADWRAELVLRVNGFQAFSASLHEAGMADDATTHFQYMHGEAEKPTESHLALNGVILPKDDPFWETHTGPWGHLGCVCYIRPLTREMVDDEKARDEKRNPDNQLVLDGPVRDRLQFGQIIRDGRNYNVTIDGPDNSGFVWKPGDFRVSLADLEKRYAPEVFAAFRAWAEQQPLAAHRSVWNWLAGQPVAARLPSETVAARLGVKATYDREAQGRRINNVLAAVKDIYGVLPPLVAALPKQIKSPDVVAVFDSRKNRIVLNSAAAAWGNMADVAEKMYQTGWWSTNSPDHVIIHELGHALHFQLHPANYDALYHAQLPATALAELQGKVSQYALKEVLEFVAETFAGLFEGKKYDAAVMKWYRHFKGPMPK